MYHTYRSKHVPTSFCKAFQDCASCHDVGTEAATFGAIVGAGCKHSKANTGASVGTEGKRSNQGNSNCIGDGAKENNKVGSVGNRNNCSGDSNDNLGDGVSKSNGASFSDGDFPKLIASRIDVDNNLFENSHPRLSDHEQLINTFHVFQRSFPLQTKVQRRRDRREHGVRFEISEVHESFIDIDTPLTSIDQSKTSGHEANSISMGSDIISPPRSVFPISFDCLYSQVDTSVDMSGTVDKMEGSHDVESFDADDEHVGSRSIDELCENRLGHKRRLPKHKRQQQQRRSALAPNGDNIGDQGTRAQGNGSNQPVGGMKGRVRRQCSSNLVEGLTSIAITPTQQHKATNDDDNDDDKDDGHDSTTSHVHVPWSGHHLPAATNRRAIQDLQSGKEAAGIPKWCRLSQRTV